MFGYVFAQKEALNEQQLSRYKACYCGLCRTLRKQHGMFGQATLTYDMTFLVVLLDALYEPEESTGCERCIVHPVHPHTYFTSVHAAYAADLNIALAYYNCADDWRDDHKLSALVEMLVLRRKRRRAEARFPRQCKHIRRCLDTLREIESAKDLSPDAAANCFGALMAELFVYREDLWADTLRRMGAALGRFIYIMDAVMDLKEDRKKGHYNPMAAMQGMHSENDFIPILTELIGECTMEFEKLPLVQDVEILRNILYNGVWTRLYYKIYQQEKEAAR